MESLFTFYLKLGLDHILDPEGYDHIAYVVALCAGFTLRDWRKTVLLVTAFTVGHSLTLVLVGLDIVQLSPKQKTVVETLIPLTIILTALVNIFFADKGRKSFGGIYALTAFFGLIHGLGFSTFFRSSVMPGESLVQPLFAFNIGVEIGQLLIVAIMLMLAYAAVNLLKVKPKTWTISVSCASLLIGIYLLL